LIAVKLFEKLPTFAVQGPGRAVTKEQEEESSTPDLPTLPALSPLKTGVIVAFVLFFAGALVWFALPDLLGRPLPEAMAGENSFVRLVNGVSIMAIPFLLSFFPLYAALKGLKVYEEMVEGGK